MLTNVFKYLQQEKPAQQEPHIHVGRQYASKTLSSGKVDGQS